MTELTVLAPQATSLESLYQQAPMGPFNEETRAFLNAFSRKLLNEPATKTHPELVALGFWLRPSNIKKMMRPKNQMISRSLGLVVHFTPANVDTMFIYSWVCALLMGNKSIVRVASQRSELQTTLFNLLNQLLNEPQFQNVAQRNLFVQYPKDSEYSAELCRNADARVIWGGDESVMAIRQLLTPPRCRDICFADRYSVALINGDELSNEQDQQSLAELVWKDTQPYGQQACSSPRIIYWLGSTEVIRCFFERLNTLAKQQGAMPLNQLNNHLVTTQLQQSQSTQTRTIVMDQICAVLTDRLNSQSLKWHLGAGYFYVVTISDVEELAAQVDHKLQTLSYWGIEKNSLLKLLESPSITGIDRIVPVGQALDFSTTWDGFDLFSMLSKQVVFDHN
jgi:hypothetical protein